MNQFIPYIYVEHSLRTPTSITAAAFTGAPWRLIEIPEVVLGQDVAEQSGWVSWRVRTHYRQNDGKCFLFGSIVGYRWIRDPEEFVRLDTRGRVIETKHRAFVSPTGSISVGNKILKVGHQGVWQVNL